MGLDTRIVGVVSDQANAYRLSFEAGHPVMTNTALTFADGMATRQPDPDALAVIRAGAERIVEVPDTLIAESIRVLHEDTHNLAEGAGAAPLAALMAERERFAGQRVGVILCGGNIDRGWNATIMAGGTPSVA